MVYDHKKLIPQFKKSEVLNKILDVFHDSFAEFNIQLKEAFIMLNIDNCTGRYLDNLGSLIGISRGIIDYEKFWLKTDDLKNSVDTGMYYVDGALTILNKKVYASDDYYRFQIRAQIIKNNLKSFSVNDLEKIAKLIFNNLELKRFQVKVKDYSTYEVDVTIDTNWNHLAIVFLQQFEVDKYNRIIFAFPYPPMITKVNIIQKDAI